MVMLQTDFVYGVVRRTLLLGAISAFITFFAVSASFAMAVMIGTLVSSINLRVTAWSIKKMLDAARDGAAAAAWSMIIVSKLFVLVGVIWVLIAQVEVDAVAFVFGFSLFMPAIGWQMLSEPDSSERDSDA